MPSPLRAEQLEQRIALAGDLGSALPNSSHPHFTIAGNVAYFAATDATHGQELWRTDGTRAGTRIVADSTPGAESGFTSLVGWAQGSMYFAARDQGALEALWKTRGDATGVDMVVRLRPGERVEGGIAFNDSLVFQTTYNSGNDSALWITDGSEIGTWPIFTAPTHALVSPPVLLGGKILFSVTRRDANWQPAGTEIWTSDGWSSGTKRIATLPGMIDNSLGSGVVFKGKLFFSASDDKGDELWSTDGTAAGTTRVKDILPGSPSSWPDSLTVCGNTLYFAASGPEGFELWKTDGTAGGTLLVKDIATGSFTMAGAATAAPRGSSPGWLTAWGTTLYFSTLDDSRGWSLWRSDGTAGGTRLVKDITLTKALDQASGTMLPVSSQPAGLTPFKGNLFFVAGSTLWKTDGTSAGTREVRPINAATEDTDVMVTDASGSYASVAVLNGRLLIADYSPNPVGIEPWVSDGTTTGTGLLANIFPESQPLQLTNVVPALSERPRQATRTRVADIVTAPGLAASAFSLLGRNAAAFETDGKSLFLKAGVSLDFETKNVYSVAVTFRDPASPDAASYQADYVLAVTDVNEPPTRVTVTPLVRSLPENTVVQQPLKVGTIVVTDDALRNNTISLAGPDAAFFTLVGNTLCLRSGVRLDFETKPRLSVVISVSDKSFPTFAPVTATFSLDITNVNEPPTKLTLVKPVARLSEATSTKQPVKVADISFVDDALGTNQVTLTGRDAAFFLIQGTSLFVKAGVTFNARAKPAYSITVNVLDPSLTASPPATTPFSLAIAKAS